VAGAGEAVAAVLVVHEEEQVRLGSGERAHQGGRLEESAARYHWTVTPGVKGQTSTPVS
jgi:hypothetical protein